MAKRRGNNEGSISKRKDGRWQGCVTVGYDPETEKPKKKYFYGKNRKEVQEKVTEALGKAQGGNYQEPSKLRLSEWFNTWLNDYMKTSLRPTTWESYKTQVDRHILPGLGHLRLSQLQTSHLQKLYNEKLNGGRYDKKPGGLSPRTVRYIHVIIHGALEQAKKEGLVTINVSDAAKLPSDPKKEIRVLDREGIKEFLSEVRPTKYFPIYFLALNTGMRRGEILGLRWKDVDLKEGLISINQGLVRVRGQGLIFQEPKTKLSKRTIGISPEVINELKLHRKRQMTDIVNAGEAFDKEAGLIFCNQLGKPICPRDLTRHFEKVIDKLGLDITFHSLRHTFATISLEEGVDIKTTQETLGHHAAAFTLDVYSSVTSKMKKEATSKIGNLLASCLE